jgi:hypothetical protein
MLMIAQLKHTDTVFSALSLILPQQTETFTKNLKKEKTASLFP